MLSLCECGSRLKAGLRFIVGSRVAKAPKDLESHFRWHGELFVDGQVIDTITPPYQRGTAVKSSDPRLRAEPAWDPAVHVTSWRAVWAYSTKRAVRDNKTLTLQEGKARAVVAGEKTARTPRFVKPATATELHEASLARARRLVGLKATSPTSAPPHARARGDRQPSRAEPSQVNIAGHDHVAHDPLTPLAEEICHAVANVPK